MADYPDGTNYEEQREHEHTDLFRDIPLAGHWITVRSPLTGERTRVWKIAARGAITLPATASRIAEHAELVGFRLQPELAQIKRIDPIRGGKAFTSPGDWVDVTAPEPGPDPVRTLAAQAGALSGAELLELRAEIDTQIEDLM